MLLGVHQQTARQADNPLVRPAAGRWWEFGRSRIGDVDADYREVTVRKLPDVGAARATRTFGSVSVGVVTNSAEKSDVFHKSEVVVFARYWNY